MEIASPQTSPKPFGRKQRQRARLRADELIAKAASLYIAGRKREYEMACRHYLSSHAARSCAAWEANRSLPWRFRRNIESLGVLAANLNPYVRSDEVVRVLMLPKNTDPGYRLSMNFGIEHKSRQYLLLPLLREIAKSELSPRQFSLRGTPKAILETVSLLKAGYVWAIETDIKNCFPSFQGELDRSIPLPKKVIRNVILANGLNMLPGDRIKALSPGESWKSSSMISELLAEARQGIPQGSTVASIAVELILAPSLSSLPESCAIVAYADNMLALGKSKEEAVSTTKALWSLLSQHPAGPLKLSKYLTYEPKQSIEFLGHRIDRFGSDVSVKPSVENEEKRQKKLNGYLKKIRDPNLDLCDREKFVREAKNYIKAWAGSFCVCDGLNARKVEFLKRIEEAAIS